VKGKGHGREEGYGILRSRDERFGSRGAFRKFPFLSWKASNHLQQLLQKMLLDGSSAVSESRKASVTSRDGGLCVLRGMDPVDVAHIVARKSGEHSEVSETGWLIFIHELVGWLDSPSGAIVQRPISGKTTLWT
jgi:hypothetical protein